MTMKTENNNRVVIAEDNPTQDEYLKFALEKLGMKVSRVTNGHEALEIDLQDHTYSNDLSNSQILNLLFSFYDSVVYKNAELKEKEYELRETNDLLLRKVEQRKKELNTQLDKISHAETILKNLEEKYRELVDNALAGIFISTLDGQVLQCNKAFIRMLEYNSPEDIMTLKTSDLYEDPTQRKSLIKKLIEQSFVREYEENLLSKKGKIIHAIINARVEGETVSGMVIDVSEMVVAETHLKEKREQLIRSRDKAETSEKLKTSFLANMSNEILSPLDSLTGLSEMLKVESLPGTAMKAYCEMIIENGNQLANIVENIIDVARIESGDVSISLFEHSINKMMLDLYVEFEQVIAESNNPGVELKLRRDIKYEDFSIQTEHFRLKSILNSLLINAVRDTEQGVIEFGYTLLSDHKAGKSGQVQFYVKHTDRGIPKEELDQIFNRFRISNVSHHKDTGGAHMGFPLIKAYIELLGGKIWIRSEPGQGSEIYFTLPFDSNRVFATQDEMNNTTLAEDHVNLKGLTILIAEDVSSNYELLRLLLSDLEPRLIWARNGREAVDLYNSEPQIDLILMDLRMPVMTGHEAIDEIRKVDKEIPIIVQTAFTQEEDKAEILEAGCNGFITKPIQKKVLLDEIKKQLSQGVAR